jgi:hypothetical protein
MPGLGASVNLLGVPDVSGPRVPLTASLSDTVRFGEGVLTANKRYYQVETLGIGIHAADTEVIRPGRIISEVVHMQATVTPNLRYSWTVAEQIFMAQALRTAVPVVLNAGIGVAPVLSTSIAVTVLQGLGIAATPLPSLKYTETLLQGIGVSPALRNFFGGALSDGIGVTSTLAKQFRAQPILADSIGIAPALSNHFYIRVTINEHIGVDDSDVLQMIYDGQLADGIEIVAGYVSPDGQFTTWVINTRTGAVSEYSNYAFNSFAKIGNRYFGASSTGLYQLTGDDDNGADIIANIKSGYAEWGGSKFTMFKAAYLGVHGAGDYVLKLVTGDGKTYTYGISGRDMRSTKVHVGKGIRTRYFAFELTSTGQDFDLDTIEFVPLVVERRV